MMVFTKPFSILCETFHGNEVKNLKVIQTSFSLLSKDRFLRNDEKYQDMVITNGNNIFGTPISKNVLLSDVLEEDYETFLYEEETKYKGIPTGQTYIDEDGDIVDFQTVTLNDHPGRIKYRISNENILISSLRLAKSPALMFDKLDLSEYVFSNGFYVFKVKNGWDKHFVLYMLRSKKLKNLLDNHIYRGIGISAYRVEDLLKCEIRKVSLDNQKIALEAIKPFEHEIRSLKSTVKKSQDIIDEVFANEFNFDYETFCKLKKIKRYTSNHYAFSNNPDLRFSAKFHRQAGDFVLNQLVSLTDKKIKHYIAEPIVLGASVSPEDYSDNGDCYYISMATIKGWKFNPEGANTVSKCYSDAKSEKTVKKDDIILARSGEGTIGKVALIDNDDVNGVFADFTMRIRLKNYNPEFAYYYFRTSYFQYLIEVYKKGLGNNTNIFPIVVREFPMLDISLDEQQRIVDEIHSEISKQDEIKSKIVELRSKIDEIIEGIIASDD